ncbi:hypothetical protein B0O99DRAFT_226793 [Bisporella sp. PMI_857]|nr:hypothetical protein B0O99DRAFT_226793 [Bisporella sp. PMI_857]
MASAQTMHDYYAILKVSNTASVDTIKKSYHRLSKELHPDKNPNLETATASFQLLQEAWGTIRDSVRRQDYDKIWPDIRKRAQKNKGIWSLDAAAAEHARQDRIAAMRRYQEGLNGDIKQPVKPRAEMVNKQREAAEEGARCRADLLKEYKADKERERREQETLHQKLHAVELEQKKRARARQVKLEQEIKELKEQVEQQRAADEAEAEFWAAIQHLENMRTRCYRKLCVAKSAVIEVMTKLEELEKLDDEDEDWFERRSRSMWHSISSSLSRSAREKHEREIRQREVAIIEREVVRGVLEQCLGGRQAVFRELIIEMRQFEMDVVLTRPDRPMTMVWMTEPYSPVPVVDEKDRAEPVQCAQQ